MNVNDAIHKLLNHQQSFVAFRLPGQIEPQLFYDGVFVKQQIDDKSLKDAFILAPFIESVSFPELAYITYKKYTGPNDFKEVTSKKSELRLSSQQPEIIGKEAYLEKVSQLINQMKQSALDKIVLSRVISKDIPSNYDWTAHYKRLCEKYPEAFVYFIALDINHFWLGATPEVLVSYANGVGETMALAGTQAKQDKTGENFEWKQKELVEQAYVRRNILEILHQFQLKWLHQGELTTKTAGQVAHLVNHFRFALSDIHAPLTLARALHPTPAVCGQPKQAARALITSSETHERAYYTGFLGAVDQAGNIRLYVNLRCMQVINNLAYIYVGGGLTADSDSFKEWEETELKAQTMLAVFSK
ncbi:MAG: isochorismate synthase [Bacteroidales bacterium]|jgi:isochorismate synthase|nr:isochorismate synthase [Bacteroidales bacterium]